MTDNYLKVLFDNVRMMSSTRKDHVMIGWSIIKYFESPKN